MGLLLNQKSIVMFNKDGVSMESHRNCKILLYAMTGKKNYTPFIIFSIPHLSISGTSPPHNRQSASPNLTVKSEPMSPRQPSGGHHIHDGHHGQDIHGMLRSHGNHLSPGQMNSG